MPGSRLAVRPMCIVSLRERNVNQSKIPWSSEIMAVCICVLICKRNERWVPIIGGFRWRLGYMCRIGTKGLTRSNLDYLSHAEDQPELPQSWQTKFRSSLKTEKLLKFCMSAVWDVTQGNNTTKTRQTSGIQNLIPLRHTRDYKRDAIIPKISHHKFTHIHVFYVHLNGQKQNANRMQ